MNSCYDVFSSPFSGFNHRANGAKYEVLGRRRNVPACDYFSDRIDDRTMER
ncbi:MAG: hypothetical protein ACJAWH_000092 [Maribacter sp.]|jgi:hypothetical protein